LNDHFRKCIRDCDDITSDSFPLLAKNKYKSSEKKGKNVSKLTNMSQRKIIIFIVRLHYAMNIMNHVPAEPENLEFNFKTFPEMKKCFEELERDLEEKEGRGKKQELVKIKSKAGIQAIVSKCTKMVKTLKKRTATTLQQLHEVEDDLSHITMALEMIPEPTMPGPDMLDALANMLKEKMAE